MPMTARPPVLRLGGGFLAFFAALGLFMPWWPLYLTERGFDAIQIGILMSTVAAFRVLGPPFVAHLADHLGRRLAIARISVLGAAAAIAVFPWLGGFAAFAAALAVYSVTWNGVLSVYDAHVLWRLEADTGRYARLRAWGSVGFIATSAAGGWWLDRVGMAALPWSIAGLLLVTFALLVSLDAGQEARSKGPPVPLGPLWRDRRVWAFLLVAFLMVASHGPYNNFFSLLLEGQGYSRAAIGLLWAWGAVAEIGVFMVAPWLLGRFSLRALMYAALAATAIRWAALAAWPDQPVLVFGTQTLHLASFGIFHLCSVAFAQSLFPPGALARGQSLLGSVGYGLGGMTGALGAGWLWQHAGSRAPYAAAALVVICAIGVAALGLRPGPYLRRDSSGVVND